MCARGRGDNGGGGEGGGEERVKGCVVVCVSMQHSGCAMNSDSASECRALPNALQQGKEAPEEYRHFPIARTLHCALPDKIFTLHNFIASELIICQRYDCHRQGRKINCTNSKTLVGGCRDRPLRALPLTFPNVKNEKTMKNMKLTCANVADDSGGFWAQEAMDDHGICG